MLMLSMLGPDQHHFNRRLLGRLCAVLSGYWFFVIAEVSAIDIVEIFGYFAVFSNLVSSLRRQESVSEVIAHSSHKFVAINTIK
jgi:hypothetical protein